MAFKISVLSAAQRTRTFGDFIYSDIGGGRIAISPQWVAEHIVECRLLKADGKGRDVHTRCHRLAKEPLERAFAELAEQGLFSLIHSFDGLWVPRHMTWNPARPLSSHSWGIAFDLNAARNPYGGGVSSENRALNEVFNRYGFAWGGDWSGVKDAMHWELADADAWKSQPVRRGAPKAPPAARLILAIAREGAFSYHAIPSAVLRAGHFDVVPAQVASALGTPLPSTIETAMTSVPLRPLLEQLEAQIIKVGDSLSDEHDPRYYVFVRPSALSQSLAA